MLYDYLHASSLRGHLCPPWARGSAWRWAKTDTSVHHETLRIRSAGPELVYRHPNLGAAPPPEPHRGRGRGTAILSNFSFLLGFRPHQWCRIAPHTAVFQDECGTGHRTWTFPLDTVHSHARRWSRPSDAVGAVGQCLDLFHVRRVCARWLFRMSLQPLRPQPGRWRHGWRWC